MTLVVYQFDFVQGPFQPVLLQRFSHACFIVRTVVVQLKQTGHVYWRSDARTERNNESKKNLPNPICWSCISSNTGKKKKIKQIPLQTLIVHARTHNCINYIKICANGLDRLTFAAIAGEPADISVLRLCTRIVYRNYRGEYNYELNRRSVPI